MRTISLGAVGERGKKPIQRSFEFSFLLRSIAPSLGSAWEWVSSPREPRRYRRSLTTA